MFKKREVILVFILIILLILFYSCNKESAQCKQSRNELIDIKEKYQLNPSDSLSDIRDSLNMNVFNNCQNNMIYDK